MQELIIKNYHGFAMEFELIDGQLMANATAMCFPFGKKPGDWLRSVAGTRYVAALQAKGEIPALVETRQGGSNPGTWINERLILKMAQWLDVDFEIQCDEWIAELLRTGKVELQVLTPAELLLKQCQQLVDHERRVLDLEVKQQADHKQIGVLGDQVAEVVAKQTTIDSKYYAISGYANLVKVRLPASAATTYGKLAAQLSRAQGYTVGKVFDGKYGEVNSYHTEILKQVFATPIPPAQLNQKRPAARR